MSLAESQTFKEICDERDGKCPQCGSDLVYPRGHECYCEECGWPDEDYADSGDVDESKDSESIITLADNGL